ncbi:MAG: hypothetical protein J5I47_02410 [Vicingus serpentipes]|nr:hypothetical protein [Vicingus serpentipes]
MKILYIPADNITANFSRSYHIAKSLSAHCELYRIMWQDNRSAFWEGKKASALNGAVCFLQSFFQKKRIIKSSNFGYEVYDSVFISAFIGRFIGKYRALVWMRKHNKKTLQRLCNSIKPDAIFHADGFYFFPALNNNINEFSDLQDDINWNNIPKQNLKEVRDYYTTQFKIPKLNFIVSESAKKSVTEYIKADFTPLSNGADFSELAAISTNQKNNFRKKFSIPSDKKIASYIGGEHKFDIHFSKQLIDKAKTALPDLVFVLAGNLPKIEGSNVFFTGILSNGEANVLYALSDVGLTLRNTANSDFIYHSVPLKFVQYAAAKKAIVSFPIKWSVDHNFPNIKHIANENVDEWINEIKKFIYNYHWENNYTLIWEKYDWKNIAARIFYEIELNKKNEN